MYIFCVLLKQIIAKFICLPSLFNKVPLSQAKLRFIFQIPNIWYSMLSPLCQPCYCHKKIRKVLFQAWALHQSNKTWAILLTVVDSHQLIWYWIFVFPFILLCRMGRVLFRNYCFATCQCGTSVPIRTKPFVVLLLQDWFSWIQDQNSYIEPWKCAVCFISSCQGTVVSSLRARQVSIVGFHKYWISYSIHIREIEIVLYKCLFFSVFKLDFGP